MPKKHMHKGGLGRALQNKLERIRTANYGEKVPIFYQETVVNEANEKKMKMQSVLEQSSLNDFLQKAELSQQSFESNRNIKFREIQEEARETKVIPNNKEAFIEGNISLATLGLEMPIRPDWSNFKTRESLELSENEAYLTWRRKLAEVEEKNDGVHITPYEKNIEIWRQLWRVVERTDLIIQIVDARDPLFFRCEGLEQYVQRFKGKECFLLLNKSDLISEQTKDKWIKLFNDHNICYAFFSAKQSLEMHLFEEEKASKEENIICEQNFLQSEETLFEKKEKHFEEKNENNNFASILSVEKFKLFLTRKTKDFNKNKIEVGFVGYPNVGKSSVINSLFGRKRVGVASMPGKTKHFQTLILNENVTLCDCPGLVFPKISASISDMVLNGLYPIDNLRAYEDPSELLTRRVSCDIISSFYAIHWEPHEHYNGKVLLEKYAILKGLTTGNGQPNCAIAARQIIKDYVSGVLVCGNVAPIEKAEEKRLQEHEKDKREQNIEKKLDDDFFNDNKSRKTNIFEMLTETHLEAIQEGRQIDFHIPKELRREIKHLVKNQKKGIKEVREFLKNGQKELHKKAIYN